MSLGEPMVDNIQEPVRVHGVAHNRSKLGAALRRGRFGEIDDCEVCPFYC